MRKERIQHYIQVHNATVIEETRNFVLTVGKYGRDFVLRRYDINDDDSVFSDIDAIVLTTKNITDLFAFFIGLSPEDIAEVNKQNSGGD